MTVVTGPTRGDLVAELAEVVGAPHEARFIVDEVLGLGLALGMPARRPARSTPTRSRRRGTWRRAGRRGSRCSTSSGTGPSGPSTSSWTGAC